MKTAMILAAGRGRRLRPITNFMPKALCSVKGTPLIERHVKNLAQAGFTNIVINHAYLGDKVRNYLGSGKQFGVNISYSAEPTGGLETGGGIVNALHLLGNDTFVTVNADIFTNYDFKNLKLEPGNLAHLVLINKPEFRPHSDFGLANGNRLSNVNKQYTFTGIACYSLDVFSKLKPGRFSVAPILCNLANSNEASGEVFSGIWSDIGSPERLRQANSNQLPQV